MRLRVLEFVDTRTTLRLDDQVETGEQELGLRLLPRPPLFLIRLLLQKRRSSDPNPRIQKEKDLPGELRPELLPGAALKVFRQ